MHDSSYSVAHGLKNLLQRTTQVGLVLFVVCSIYIVGSTGTTFAQPHLSQGSASLAHTNAAHIISGKAQGTKSVPKLSSAERAIMEARLQRMHPALPTVPVGVDNGIHPDKIAASQVRSALPMQRPLTSVKVQVSNLGSQMTSQVDEPSVATDGANILQTWNWYSGISANGGSSWTYYDPKALFSNDYGGWCCDSVAIYDHSRNLFIWDLLYLPDQNGGAFRLAIANGASDLSQATFHSFDLTPQQTGGAVGDWYDYPKISLSDNFAYLQANVYNSAQQYVRTLVMRFSLDALAQTGAINYSYFNTPGVFSVTFTHGASSVMYFASHLSTNTLRVFSWGEDSNNISWNSVGHVSYPSASFSCPRTGVDNSNWCSRSDSRMLDGWVSNGIIGFSWNASQGQWGFSGSAPYPYTDIVRINQFTLSHIDDPVVWNPNFAFMYMSHYPNSKDSIGAVGGTFLYGGGQLFENGGVYIWDGSGHDFVGLVASNQDATSAGDYLTARPLGLFWSGTLYSLRDDGVHPYYVTFGR